GANVKLSDATYVYADVEKTFGGEIDTNWQWNLGVRYSF
ncbi:MAG: autotransporter outer membrane beta-barrel domain-containing protein, partial [Selenomonadales bacterium]|nr:autotransporter outer membrane beta-barrel domain-containing protein [Selenomonadales bacterium]